MLKSVTSILVPVHREGWPFIAIFALVALVMFWLLPDVFGWIGAVLTLWCAYFFRDPPRSTPLREGLVISPADGRVLKIDTVVPGSELDLPREPVARISIFMNVFDVHINRSPVDGRIERLAYVPGKFLSADLDKESDENERMALTIATDSTAIGVVQIAGLVARRIVPFVKEGDSLLAGQRFGIIRFGSRVDIYLPPGCAALVAPGQRAIAGETVVADLKSTEATRPGRMS